jgi:hypothetical protein
LIAPEMAPEARWRNDHTQRDHGGTTPYSAIVPILRLRIALNG